MSRSAEATIKGYYYQFDTSIKSLLELHNDEDYITVEGIEDIDIVRELEKSTIQCKYLSKPNYTHSSVREPIELMLNHFRNQSDHSPLKYILYVHFTDEIGGQVNHITLDDLKSILTYKEKSDRKCYYKEHSLSDENLTTFLSKFQMIFGLEFNHQQSLVIDNLCKIFKCSKFLADFYYYNNALRIIIDKAIKSNPSLRVITRNEFIKSIDNKKKLFNEWYIALRTKENYFKLLKNIIRESDALMLSRSKTVILGEDILSKPCSEMPINIFIENLINKYYKLGSVFNSAIPITFVFEQSDNELIETKRQLIGKNIIYNDGYENINFNYIIFNESPIINYNNAKNRIAKSSFLLKILSFNTFTKNITLLNKSDVIFFFSKKEFYHPNLINSQWYDVKYCDHLNDVYGLLTK